MTILTIASTKGGCGKTTISRIISAILSDSGYSVAGVDADINRSFSRWQDIYQGSKPATIVHEIDHSKIVRLCRDLAQKHDVVIVDTAGFGNQAQIFAIGASNAVLIPSLTSADDVAEAVKTVRLVQSASEMTQREIPYRVVLSGFSGATNVASHVSEEFRKAGLPLMQRHLSHLVGYKELSFGIPLTRGARLEASMMVDELIEIGFLPPDPAERGEEEAA